MRVQPRRRSMSQIPSERKGSSATIAMATGYFNMGAVNAWSGSALIQLERDYILGPTQFGLVVSSITVGAGLAALIGGKVCDLIGRKSTILLSGPMFFLGWLLIACSSTINTVILGRFMCGVATGFVVTPAQIYTSETADSWCRGVLGSLLPLALTLGIVTTYAVGGFLHWRTSCYVFMGTAVLSTFLVLLVPESPYWYLLKGRQADALRTMARLRGHHYDVYPEMKQMQNKIHSSHQGGYKELFERRTALPLAVVLFIHSVQQLSALNVIMMFTSTIFKDAHSFIRPEYATLFSGFAQLISTVISMCLIDKLGRRALISVSSVFMGVGVVCLGAYFYSLRLGLEWAGWIPVVTILCTVFCYCLGCRSIPWIVSSEMFNTSIRASANSLCVFYNRLLNFSIVQMFPYLQETLGYDTVFLMFGAIGIILGITALFVVPETKNKTLEEIQEYFEGRADQHKAKKANLKTDTL